MIFNHVVEDERGNVRIISKMDPDRYVVIPQEEIDETIREIQRRKV